MRAPTRWVFGGRRHYCLVSAPCVSRRVEYIRKALEKGYSEHPDLHAVLTMGLRFSSVLDGAGVAHCLFLSTGSDHVCIKIHTTSCFFPQCTTEAFGSQKSTLWG